MNIIIGIIFLLGIINLIGIINGGYIDNSNKSYRK